MKCMFFNWHRALKFTVSYSANVSISLERLCYRQSRACVSCVSVDNTVNLLKLSEQDHCSPMFVVDNCHSSEHTDSIQIETFHKLLYSFYKACAA